jgi:hypothetical protein
MHRGSGYWPILLSHRETAKGRENAKGNKTTLCAFAGFSVFAV